MKTLLKNNKGLSTVVTTLIILVVSVLLATVVTFYAINVTTTRVQEESIQLRKLHFWHNGTTFSEAAVLLINTGGRDLVIDKMSVRGQESDWANVWYSKTQNSISEDLPFVTPEPDGTLNGTAMVTLDNVAYDFTQGTTGDDFILRSGWSMIIYITNPDSLSVNDIGVTIGLTIFTANAQYYKESNVEASA